MSSNLIHDVASSGIYFHCGTDNHAINNIIISADIQESDGYIKSCNRGGNPTWPNITHGFSFSRNIVYVNGDTPHQQLTSDTDYRDTKFDKNLYYTPISNLSLVFPNHTTWSQ